MNMLLAIISFLVIAVYTAAVCVKQGGVPNSISATFYKLEHKAWFMATMWLTAGLLMPAIMEVSTENSQFLAFLACTGMFLVGAAPNFWEEFEGDIHELGAMICIVGSQLWVMLNCPWCLMAWAAYVVYTIVMMPRHVSDSIVSDFLWTRPVFWVEISALLATYMSVFWGERQ